jgi:peptide/nickel transport system permease protein
VHSNPTPHGFAGFIDLLYHLSLPLLTLVVLSVWGTAYLTRNIVMGNLQEDFVMAARARGISEGKVLFSHTLRTSMPAIMTLAVLSLFTSIGGNIIVEGIFSWPGLGNLYFVAVQQNDVPVLMGNLTIQTMINMVGFILLDLIYGILDPRIKVGGKG